MPEFIPIFFVLFFAVFIAMIIYSISYASKLRKQNNIPIKSFSVDGKKYFIFSKQNYNRYYNNQVVYELRDRNNLVIGTFNSLNDILVLLSIDEFPSEDMFE